MGAQSASGAGPANDAMELDNNNESDADYDDNESGDDIDIVDTEGASAPRDEERSAESRKNHWLRRVIWTNDNYDLGAFMVHPDPRFEDLVVFKTVELQALRFFLSHSLVLTGGFTDVDLLI